MTEAEKKALRWLYDRNGDGVFDKDGVLIAAGQSAPIMRSTWNSLVRQGYVMEYMKRKRLKTTEAGDLVAPGCPQHRAWECFE